jgi:hypothetical protein
LRICSGAKWAYRLTIASDFHAPSSCSSPSVVPAESIDHLRGLLRAFDDATALKAITLILSKAAPVLGVIGAELRRPSDSKTE